MLTILGTAAALLTICRAIPQIVLLLRTRDGTAGVSYEASVVYVLTYLPWIVYGITTDQTAVTTANAGGAAAYTTVAILTVRYGQPPAGWWHHTTWIVGITAGALIGGVPGATAVTYLAPVAYGIPQVRDAITAPSVASLSPSTLLLAATEVSLWLTYAALVGDLLLGGYMTLALTVQLATFAVWAVRRHNQRRTPATQTGE